MPVELIDVAMVATMPDKGNPTGEAGIVKEGMTPMTAEERSEMMGRLFAGISQLTDKAQAIHAKHNIKKPDTHKPESHEIDLEQIIRISTNEFAFYTQEPLTIEEFQSLQNKIAEKTKTLPAGIQFVLGSFAVKMNDNKVVNVTPHISCGAPPSFQFIVKNHTSPIDYHYSELDEESAVLEGFFMLKDLEALDVSTKEPHLPNIVVDGVPCAFTFNNIVRCLTPKGKEFITAVDICLDHAKGVAKSNLLKFMMEHPDCIDLPITYMVISNVIDISPIFSIGLAMHVDPRYSSSSGCKIGVAQVMEDVQPVFGKDPMKLIELAPTRCEKLANMQIDALNDLKFGGMKDSLMDEYIRKKIEEYKRATPEQKQSWLSELNKLITEQLASDELDTIRATIADLRKGSSFFTIGYNRTANSIQDVMREVSVEARAHLNGNPGVLAKLEAIGITFSKASGKKSSSETVVVEEEVTVTFKVGKTD